jgi:hypothetical protein
MSASNKDLGCDVPYATCASSYQYHLVLKFLRHCRSVSTANDRNSVSVQGKDEEASSSYGKGAAAHHHACEAVMMSVAGGEVG